MSATMAPGSGAVPPAQPRRRGRSARRAGHDACRRAVGNRASGGVARAPAPLDAQDLAPAEACAAAERRPDGLPRRAARARSRRARRNLRRWRRSTAGGSSIRCTPPAWSPRTRIAHADRADRQAQSVSGSSPARGRRRRPARPDQALALGALRPALFIGSAAPGSPATRCAACRSSQGPDAGRRRRQSGRHARPPPRHTPARGIRFAVAVSATITSQRPLVEPPCACSTGPLRGPLKNALRRVCLRAEHSARNSANQGLAIRSSPIGHILQALDGAVRQTSLPSFAKVEHALETLHSMTSHAVASIASRVAARGLGPRPPSPTPPTPRRWSFPLSAPMSIAAAGSRGRMFALQCAADSLIGFIAPRFCHHRGHRRHRFRDRLRSSPDGWPSPICCGWCSTHQRSWLRSSIRARARSNGRIDRRSSAPSVSPSTAEASPKPTPPRSPPRARTRSSPAPARQRPACCARRSATSAPRRRLATSVSPAAEWLLDNFHLIEAQLRGSTTGCRAATSATCRCCRTSRWSACRASAWRRLGRSSPTPTAPLDDDLLVHFLRAYEEVRELTLGELWALPTTLRVVLIENLRRLAERAAANQAAREIANPELRCEGYSPEEARPDSRPAQPARRRRRVPGADDGSSCTDHRSPANQRFFDWLQRVAPHLAEIQTRLPAAQAADNLSCQQRDHVAALDQRCRLGRDRCLNQRPDPAHAHPLAFAAERDETFATRRCIAIEKLARRCGPQQSARWRRSCSADARRRVLAGERRRRRTHRSRTTGCAAPAAASLRRALGLGSDRSLAWHRLLQRAALPAYLGAIGVTTLVLVAWLLVRHSAALASGHVSRG